ncbi:MAG: signal peptide peptidase SppA [Rikenellaceae bacterium]
MTFFKTFSASLLAFLLAGGALLVLFMLALVAMISSSFSSRVAPIGSEGVLKIDFAQKIVDSPNFAAKNSLDFSTLTFNTSLSLLDVIAAIEAAMSDDRIKGIYLDFNSPLSMSFAMAEELRSALLKFKISGKFVVAYGEYYSQGALFLASVADKIYLNPEGGVQWQGLALNQIYYKGLFDKLGVEAYVLRSGDYKSAVEPYILTQMSKESKVQEGELVNSLWQTIVQEISKSREINLPLLQSYADKLSVVYPEDAERFGFVDSLLYFDKVQQQINLCMAKAKDEKINFVSLSRYVDAISLKASNSKNKIAVVYVDGQIISGKSEDEMVGSETVCRQLRKVREDKNVKALVLRVNSPGGSALASEVIYREVELVKQKIPVIVSMGGIAASGGYYVAAPADAIVASRMTLTGSIGVFSLMFDAKEGMNKHLGITSDGVKTNTSADMQSVLRKPTKTELDYGQKQVDRVYKTFKNRVEKGRNLSEDDVEKLAQGRVYTGEGALKRGLIDGIGGFSSAILFAEQRANLNGDFTIWQLREEDDTLTALLKQFGTSNAKAQLRNEITDAFVSYKTLQNIITQQNKVWAYTPYIYELQ